MSENKSKSILLKKKDILALPQGVGVYVFKKKNRIFYIGKSISLKARILSHLENAKLDPKEAAIIKNSDRIEYYITDSEFKALLLESSLIQKNHPKYNRRWQDDKSYLYIKITVDEDFPKVLSVRKENDGKSVYFGPFPSRGDVEELLRTIRRIFPFCTQKKIGKKPCFYSKIGLCNPCPNEIVHRPKPDRPMGEKARHMKRLYRYTIRQVIRVLSGNVDLVLKNIYRKIGELSKQQRFEEAILLRDKILHFEKTIHQKEFTDDIFLNYNKAKESIAHLKKLLQSHKSGGEALQRIECYDISNLSQKDATASMVVFVDGLPDKSQYRRFRIKNLRLRSDFAMLGDVFERRFKHNWQKPNLIVVDGGTPQVLKVTQVFQKLGKEIPLLGIAKHPDRIVLNTPTRLVTLRPSINNLGFNLLRALRDEAHRFARKYHLLLRSKKMLK